MDHVEISIDYSRSYKSWPVAGECYLALPVRRTDISRTPPRGARSSGSFVLSEDRAQSICCPLSTPFTSLRHLSRCTTGRDNRGSREKGIYTWNRDILVELLEKVKHISFVSLDGHWLLEENRRWDLILEIRSDPGVFRSYPWIVVRSAK